MNKIINKKNVLNLLTLIPLTIINVTPSQALSLQEFSEKLEHPETIIAQIRDRNDFFRQGDQQLEQEIQRLQQQKPENDLLTIQGEKQTWQAILFEEAGFSVWMPSGTMRQEMVDINTDAGTLDFKVTASHLESSSFTVGYSNTISSDKLTNQETLFNQIRDGIATQTELKVSEEKDISFEDYTGKELILEDNDQKVTVQVYLINQRFYLLGVSQSNQDNISESINAFFQSFKLEK